MQQIQLLDANIVAAFPQLLNADHPTVCYKVEKITSEAGEIRVKYTFARVCEKLSGEYFLLRKSLTQSEEEAEASPIVEGDVHPKGIILLETNSDQIIGGEMLLDTEATKASGNPVAITSSGKSVRRIIMFQGDNLQLKSSVEVVPGVVTDSVQFEPCNLTTDVRLGYDSKPRTNKTSVPSAAAKSLMGANI